VLLYSLDGRCQATYSAYDMALGIKSITWSSTSQFLAIGSYDEKVQWLCIPECYLIATDVQCESKKIPPPPKKKFWNFFPNGWEFFVQILHACYTFLCTLNYTFLFTYLQLWRSYAILNVRTQFTSYVQMSTIGQTARWHFLTFFPYSWEFLVGILYVYYTFLSTLGFKFLFYYLQLWRSYAILSVTTKCAFRSMVDILSM